MTIDDRRLAAIVLADVVGYSRLMGLDESGTLNALTRHRQDLLEPTAHAFGGKIVKTGGDSFLLIFTSVVDAVRCTIALQQGMAARNASIAPDRHIMFRIGVNLGDIIFRDEDVFGDGVNVTARLERLAEPGGICVSRAAYDQVRDVVGVTMRDMGPHVVKNIARPVQVFAISAQDLASFALTVPAPRVVPRPSNRRLVVVAAVTLSILFAAGGLLVWRRRPAIALKDDLASVLATELPSSTAKARSRLLANYMSMPAHRAFFLAPLAKSRWYTGEWTTPDEAVTKGLERCQVFHGEPCAAIAVDDAMLPRDTNGGWTVRDMPRVHYAGPFNPDWIPGVRSTTAKRTDVVAYATAPAPKAVAYHVRGLLFVVTGSASQNEAEVKALQACNAEPSRRESDGPCMLYAVDNRVVLPDRRTTFLTAP